MVVKQVLGNNIVSSWDSNGQEVLLMGKGIGFAVKPGSPVDESKISKTFFLTDFSREFPGLLDGGMNRLRL